MNGKYVLAVIPARGGSKGVPQKNMLDLNGKPVISYTIETALNTKIIDCTVVSTEDQKIAEIAARQHGVEVIMRPPEYATDDAPIELALRHALREIEKREIRVDIVVLLYANVPVRKNGIIEKAVEKLIQTGADSVQSYTPFETPPFWACNIEGDKVSLVDPAYKFAYRRQLLPEVYYPDGAVVALQPKTLMEQRDEAYGNALLGDDRRGIIQASEDTVDVDEPIDLLWAEFLLSRAKT